MNIYSENINERKLNIQLSFLIKELNFVEKLSEKNSQLSNENKNAFTYEITEEIKEKSHNIYNSLNDKQLKNFVILNFQRNIILEDEEDKKIKKKSSKLLNEINLPIDDKIKESNYNNFYLNEIKKSSLNNKIDEDNNICKIQNNKEIEKEKKFINELLSDVSKNEKNCYYQLNKKFIYSKLEKNINNSNNFNSDSDKLKHNNNIYTYHQLNNISPLLKSLQLSTSLKHKNNNNENINNNNLQHLNSINNISQDLYINKKNYNNDSLYNLFNSDCFNMHLLMYYLSIKDESSIIDVLVNIIYSKCIDQSLFYIPQLCFLISNKKFYESIENYVLDTCVDQIKFSLIAHWLLSSYIEHDDLQVVRKFDKFMQRIEMTLVNGRRATLSNYRMFNSLNKKSDEDVVLNSLDKEFRLEYFDKISKFYNDLKSMCEKLKKYPKEDKLNENLTRKGKLQCYLKRFNKKLKELFQNVINQKNMHANSLNKNNTNNPNAENNNIENNSNYEKDQQMLLDEKILNYKFNSKSLSLFRGYILPFDDNKSTIDEYNSLIVNFLPEYSFCFSTKARVPVKLTVETIKVFEAEFWDDLIIKEEENEINNANKDQDEGKSINTRISQINDDKIKKDYVVIEFNSLEDFLMQMESENKNNKLESIEDSQKKITNDKINGVNQNQNINDYNNEYIDTEMNENLNQSRLDTIPDNNEKEEIDQQMKEKNMVEELSRIIQQEKNSINNNYPLSSRSKNLENKLNSYRKSVMSSNNYSGKKKEEFLAEASPTIINPFGRNWQEIENKIKQDSIFRNFETYEVKNFIAKANDDLRQELMTMQLIKRFDDIFKTAEIPLKLKPYEILITSPSSGLIEFIPNTISIDALKKKIFPETNLNIFFRNFFVTNFEEAQKNFAESLAAYSIVQHVLNIKDRHNGNILLDLNGHVIHIDYGFILGISPGNLGFESAPFKLTAEYVDIMDGVDSNIFHYFKSLILRGLIELRKNIDYFVKIIEIMSKGSKMPCFMKEDPKITINKFIERLNGNKSEVEMVQVVEDLIYNSIFNWRTVQYDNFQKFTNDICP